MMRGCSRSELLILNMVRNALGDDWHIRRWVHGDGQDGPSNFELAGSSGT